jgi:glycine cleavage system H protein
MNRRFTKSHEWIELEGRKAKVGITHYAQKELGEIVYAQLPTVGQSVLAGEEVCVLESTKAAADVYSPVSGQIIAVNDSVVGHPHLVNKAPESTAWLFQIELSDPKEFDALLTKSAYESLIQAS